MLLCDHDFEASFGWCVLDCQHCLLIKASLRDIPEGSTTKGWLYSKNMSTYPAGKKEPWWDSIFGSLLWGVLCTSPVVPDWERKSMFWDDPTEKAIGTYSSLSNSLLQSGLWLWCISTCFCCCYVGYSLYNKLNICKPGQFELWESS